MLVRGPIRVGIAQTVWLCLVLVPAAAGQTAAAAQPWQPVGPAPIESSGYGPLSGRVSAVAFDPSDPTGNTTVIGTAGGGVWRSSNTTGASPVFTPLTDDLLVFNNGEATASLAIGAVTVQPGSTGVLLAGTGEASPLADAQYGEGLLRSADNGQSWQLVQGSQDGVGGNHSFTGEGFAAFAWGPGTGGSQTVVAAVGRPGGSAQVGAITLGASVRGLFVSMDAGQSWQLATIEDVTTAGVQTVQSGETDYSSYDGNSALAVVWNPLRQLYFAVVQQHGIYSSPDGATWTRLATQPGGLFPLSSCPTDPGFAAASSCPLWQAALAVDPASGDMFFWAVDASGNDQGIWQDVCSAQNGICSSTVTFSAQINDAPLDGGSTTIPNGANGIALAVVPTAAGADATLLAGAQQLWQCDLGSGCAWQAAAANVFPGVRGLAALPGTQRLLLGTAGGLWSSPDAGATFTNLNGTLGPIASLTSIAASAANAGVLLAGAGTLGTLGTGGVPAWQASGGQAVALAQLQPGTGGGVALDDAGGKGYAALGPGVQLGECVGAADCLAGSFQATLSEAQVENDQSLPQVPFALDPANMAQMIVATCRVWRGAADGAGWTGANAISPMLDGNQQGLCSGNTLVRSIAAGGPDGPAGSSVVYAGMQGAALNALTNAGHIFVTTTATTTGGVATWNDIASSPVTNGGLQTAFNPLQFDVSSIFVDPHDPSGGTVYATIYGFHVPHLYFSNNFGASWLNASADLPDAPANAVTVDPNNANIVYVAMDTGVYSTQNIKLCAMQNCWQQYGAGLPNAAVTALEADGGTTGLLRAATRGRGAWQVPLASSPLASETTVAVSPASLAFPAQQLGTISAAESVSITVTGANALTVSGVNVTGEFTETDNCTGATISIGGTCTVQVVFAPSTPGASSGALTLYGNLPAGQAGPLALSGTALGPPAIQLSPAGTLAFGDVVVGQSSAAQLVEVENTGQAAATLDSFGVSGSFAITQNACGITLLPNTGCTVSVVFAPQQRGAQTGAFSVTDSAGRQQLALTGTGQAPASVAFAPQQLQFPPTSIGQTSPSATIMVTNSGDVGATITAIQASGDFSVTNSCGQQVAGDSSCALSVAFAPTQNGPLAGTLTLTIAAQTLTAQLSGTGVGMPALTLTPSVLNFGAENLQQASAPQTITVANTGNAPDTIISVATQGLVAGTADYAATTNCATLAPSATCTIVVTFTPGVAGADNGTLTVNASVANTSVNALLKGSGNTLAFTAGQQPAASVPAGQMATYAVQLQVVGYAGTVQMECSGLPAGAACSFPGQPQLSQPGYASLNFTVSTGPDVAASATYARRWLLALCAPLLLPIFRRRLTAACLLMLAATFAITSCAGGTAAVSQPVAPGSYTFTVTASGGGMTSTLPILLTVQ